MKHFNFILARRNIFRNSRRTFLTIFLIASGLAALLFTDAFVRGISASMVKIVTQTYLGDAQIHRPGFRQSNDIDLYLKENSELFKKIEKQKEIKAYSPRTITGGMLSSSENVASAVIYGVDAEKEAELSKIKQAIIQGQYLTGKNGEIIVGEGLANLLEVKLGDRLVITVSQANSGELSQELFRLSGIFYFDDRRMNKSIALINLQQGQAILNIDGVHEVALRFNNINDASDDSLLLWKRLNNENLETLSWRELVPQLSSILKMNSFSTLIASVIISVLVILGLINSMFMSIYERQNEFGILLALGTRPRQLFWLIILEGFYIGVISIIFGLLTGGLISYWKSVTGIDYSGVEISGVSISEPIYLLINGVSFLKIAASILTVTVLSCVYPAIHAASLRPSLAMK